MNTLLLKLKEGDEKAYEAIFHEYYALLTAFANKYLRDLDTSKEIAQNIFVKFYEKREIIEVSSSLKAYLFRMVHNDCISYIRKKNYVDSQTIALENEQQNISDYQNFQEQTEEEYKLHKLIEQLPPKCKQIFKLSRFEEKKHHEIAAMLNLSPRTVEGQISRAMKFLKENYKILSFTLFY